jgi:alanyl-tRNA synthetase
MQGHVDIPRRNAKQRAHTATHLLHAAIQRYIPDTKQMWSFVGEDELRFDFATDRLLTREELHAIQLNINAWIIEALVVRTDSMPYTKAIALGAKAFFADTYGDVVRVVRVGEGDGMVSLELCGGNHVLSTDHIGCFVVVAQEAVAQGVKRITAVTWPRVQVQLEQKDNILHDVMQITSVKSPALIIEKLTKTMQSYTTLQDQYTSILDRYVAGVTQTLVPSSVAPRSYIVSSTWFSLSPQDLIRGMKQYHSQQAWIVYDVATSFIAIHDPVSASAKDIAATYNIQWGGTPSFVQGKYSSLPDFCA